MLSSPRTSDSPGIQLRMGRDGAVLAANAAFERLPEEGSAGKAALKAACRRALAEGAAGTVELVDDGGSRALVAETALVRVDDGRAQEACLVALDVTRREMEGRTLRRDAALYDDAQNAAQLGVWNWDLKTGAVTWSAGLYRIYGLDPARHAPSYESYMGLIHPDDRDRIARVIRQVVAEGGSFSHDEKIARPDRTIRHLHTWGHAVLDSKGKTAGLVGVCQDITETVAARDESARGHILLRAIVEDNPNAIFLKDLDGRYLVMNAAGGALFGLSPEGFVGRTDADVLPADLREESARREAALLVSRERDVHEFTAQLNGRSRTLIVTKAVWRDRSGRANGITGCIQDITERQTAERQRDEAFELERQARLDAEATHRRLRFLSDAGKVLSSSLDFRRAARRVVRSCVPAFADWCSLFTTDEGGRLRLAAAAHRDPEKSKALTRFLRGHPPSVEGGGLADVVRSGRGRLAAVVDAENIESMSYSPEHQRLLQSLGVSSAMILPLEARGRALGAVGFFCGPSGRRFLESDRAVGEEFARRAAVALDNAHLFEETKRGVELRNQFLAVVSHELKAPLSLLQLRVELLGQTLRTARLSAPLLGELDPALNGTLSDIGRVARLVDALVDLSRIAAGALPLYPAPMNLAKSVRNALADVKTEPERLEFDPVVELDEAVEGNWDRVRVEQVLRALLSNAAKFGSGKPVRVALRRRACRAYVSVEDQGIGVAPQDQERLFNRVGRSYAGGFAGGAGLSLYLAERFALAHGGALSVRSERDRGSTFTFELPL